MSERQLPPPQPQVLPLRRDNSGVAFNMDEAMPLELGCSVTFPSTSNTPWNNVETGQNECVTIWEPIQLRQEWTIHNISRALELSTPGICMRSRGFRDESMPEITWQLCLYPGGKREENKGNVSLFLKMSTSHTTREFTVRAEYCFYFMDDAGAARFSNVNTGDFKVKPSKGSHSWGLRNIPKQKVLNSVRSDDSLHIVCQIETVPDFNKIQPAIICREAPVNLAQLSRDHEKLFNDERFADFKIYCGESRQLINVHRVLLASRSQYFSALLSPHTKEYATGELELPDVDFDIFSEFIFWIYTSRAPRLRMMALAMLSLADRFQAEELKNLSAKVLAANLRIDNACEVLVKADLYNALELKNDTLNFIVQQSSRILKTSHWENLLAEHPRLVTEICAAMSEKSSKSVSFEPSIKRIRLL